MTMAGNTKRRRKKALLEMQRDRCAYCLCLLTLDTATVDHIKPRAYGGHDRNDNLVAACWSCNQMRGTMSALKFWTIKATTGGLAVPAAMVR